MNDDDDVCLCGHVEGTHRRGSSGSCRRCGCFEFLNDAEVESTRRLAAGMTQMAEDMAARLAARLEERRRRN